MRAPSPKVPHIAALLAAVLGLIAGILGHPAAGAGLAAAGIVPACWGMWAGMQQRRQGGLAISILLFFLALGVAALLLLAVVLGWLGA